MKEALVSMFERLVPAQYHLPARLLWLRSIGMADEEMFYISDRLKSKRRCLDVGANMGIYSYHFSKTFSKVEAFEPLEEIPYRLRAMHRPGVTIHNVALSNSEGKLQFNIPLMNGQPIASLASLEPRDDDCEVRQVQVRTIDDYGFDDVDLIKIDVEGHEQHVIEGGRRTISACQPNLMIEIEQRHIKNDIVDVFRQVESFNYDGYFLQDNDLQPIAKFSYDRHQRPFLNDVMSKGYVNNFLFFPRQS